MKILLIGANGQIGYELARQLPPLGEVIALDRTHMDLTDPDQVRAVIRYHQPQLLINAAACTAVDQAESEPELTMRINAEAPAVMAQEAQALGAGMIHYSTDYVFDGSKDGSYEEDDATNPLNVYGRSKLAGELAVATACEAHWIFRTSWVYGVHGNNFLKTMMRLMQEREQLAIVADQIGAPTWARTIGEVTRHLLTNGNGDTTILDGLRATSGLYHLTAGGATSWHEYACFIATQLQAHRMAIKATADKIAAIPSAAYPTPAARPLNSRLSLEKMRKTFAITMPAWQSDVTACQCEIISGYRKADR